jgi:hypothetical protein
MRYTSRWYYPRDNGNQEPNYSLAGGKTSKLKAKQQAGIATHLIPEEAPHSKRAGYVTAQAKQANKHNEKQGDVRSVRDDHVNLGTLEVWHAGLKRGFPFGVNLHKDEPKGFHGAEIDWFTRTRPGAATL